MNGRDVARDPLRDVPGIQAGIPGCGLGLVSSTMVSGEEIRKYGSRELTSSSVLSFLCFSCS